MWRYEYGGLLKASNKIRNFTEKRCWGSPGFCGLKLGSPCNTLLLIWFPKDECHKLEGFTLVYLYHGVGKLCLQRLLFPYIQLKYLEIRPWQKALLYAIWGFLKPFLGEFLCLRYLCHRTGRLAGPENNLHSSIWISPYLLIMVPYLFYISRASPLGAEIHRNSCKSSGVKPPPDLRRIGGHCHGFAWRSHLIPPNHRVKTLLNWRLPSNLLTNGWKKSGMMSAMKL